MKRFLTCVALLGLLVGCKEPLPEDPIIPDGKLPINLLLSTSRANDSAYEAGDQIGLYVVNYADGVATQLANSGNHVNNMQFTLTDGDWIPATKIYWKDKSTRADFYAYYPYQSTVADVTALPVSVQADQSSEENYWASDLLWGKTSGVAPTESAVNIATTHALSNLLIYVEPGYGFTAESLAAANVSVEINNVKTAGALNLTNGEVTASGEAGTITPWNIGEYYRALIVPQTVADETTLITVTVDGKAHTIEQGFTFVPNTQHKFVVRIENDVETKVTLSINPWNQDPNTYGIPDNEIWYTSTDGEIVVPNASASFGANLLSNTYVNGKGVITLDGDVSAIGDWAFIGCSSLTSITIPESVTSIGLLAFIDCSSLTSITIPESVTSIGNSAFSFCSSLTSITIPDGVTSIGDWTFNSCSSLASITIPESVTSIGDSAFSFCSSLTTITIPEGVTSIGDYAFGGCSSLTSITIPESLTSIGERTFCNCSSLASITIPESVTSIEENPFEGCANLKEFNGKFASTDGRCLIVDGVLNSFAPVGLTEYIIPESVTSIGWGAFLGCSSLTSITIPESVTSIGEGAFHYCRSLTSITIPESVTSIERNAFSGCSSLTSITISEGVTSIGFNPFGGCANLKEFSGKFASADGRCLIVDGVLNSFAPAGLTEYIIPESVTSIGDWAFLDCSSLTSITIPESVTSIGEGAFSSCSSLTSITIPESVTSIGEVAFLGCLSLKSVYCKPTTPPNGGSNMFYSNASGRKIYVPASDDDSIINAYKAADGWKDYADAIEEYEFD